MLFQSHRFMLCVGTPQFHGPCCLLAVPHQVQTLPFPLKTAKPPIFHSRHIHARPPVSSHQKQASDGPQLFQKLPSLFLVLVNCSRFWCGLFWEPQNWLSDCFVVYFSFKWFRCSINLHYCSACIIEVLFLFSWVWSHRKFSEWNIFLFAYEAAQGDASHRRCNTLPRFSSYLFRIIVIREANKHLQPGDVIILCRIYFCEQYDLTEFVFSGFRTGSTCRWRHARPPPDWRICC